MKFLIKLAASDVFLSQGFLFFTSNTDSNPGFRRSDSRYDEKIDFLEVSAERDAVGKGSFQKACAQSMKNLLPCVPQACGRNTSPQDSEKNTHKSTRALVGPEPKHPRDSLSRLDADQEQDQTPPNEVTSSTEPESASSEHVKLKESDESTSPSERTEEVSASAEGSTASQVANEVHNKSGPIRSEGEKNASTEPAHQELSNVHEVSAPEVASDSNTAHATVGRAAKSEVDHEREQPSGEAESGPISSKETSEKQLSIGHAEPVHRESPTESAPGHEGSTRAPEPRVALETDADVARPSSEPRGEDGEKEVRPRASGEDRADVLTAEGQNPQDTTVTEPSDTEENADSLKNAGTVSETSAAPKKEAANAPKIL